MPSPLTDTLEALETEIARRSRREKLLRIAAGKVGRGLMCARQLFSCVRSPHYWMVTEERQPLSAYKPVGSSALFL
jgi:hypothetical protein